MSHNTIKDGIDCVISKDYFYKTESYYELILKEISGKNKVFPSSNDVLDAYRITSYNVCYTKLLRVITEVKGITRFSYCVEYG